MTDQETAEDATRLAIEFLMQWMSDDRQAAAKHIAGVLHGENAPDPTRTVAGLLNLNMIVLFELAKAHGAEDYRAWAEEYLKQRALRMPEA
ncbi:MULTISPECIES: hypothetical protein [Streptomyces]|uniref:hypothetical protein n=1 Tax=Streptomyces TaxID=1883 RepID=UPI00055CD01E|nr:MULTISPECIES: hypothetical protein [Streptomyces]MBZ6110595.1 hypothetical protein [Streptomyces olivaceus]MBZ6123386.1 hypothetical protein [Streptomyces olivaceus]MBZ6146540.1 hypothetical protein [Streptomyces olivaceus]MBZ6158664.1 hypothetical protein [Streptomyces olivaceus]MBZ6188546.1 hypothetical protein [Streptomyces olivaceus]